MGVGPSAEDEPALPDWQDLLVDVCLQHLSYESETSLL